MRVRVGRWVTRSPEGHGKEFEFYSGVYWEATVGSGGLNHSI